MGGYYPSVIPNPEYAKLVKKRTERPKFDRVITVHGSSVVKAVQYDLRRNVLDATLKNGRKYRYYGVMADEFAALVTSKSCGAMFNSLKNDPYIKSRRLPSKS